MRTLILDDVPNDLYEALVEQAARNERSLCEEAICLLRKALRGYDPNQSISAPFDLPLPDSVVRAKGRHGPPPLPDPIE